MSNVQDLQLPETVSNEELLFVLTQIQEFTMRRGRGGDRYMTKISSLLKQCTGLLAGKPVSIQSVGASPLPAARFNTTAQGLYRPSVTGEVAAERRARFDRGKASAAPASVVPPTDQVAAEQDNDATETDAAKDAENIGAILSSGALSVDTDTPTKAWFKVSSIDQIVQRYDKPQLTSIAATFGVTIDARKSAPQIAATIKAAADKENAA